MLHMDNRKVMDRRSFMRRGSSFVFSVLGLGLLTGAYSSFGERFWYEVTKVTLPIHSLPHAFKGWKIVHISDVHFGFHFGLKELKRVVKIINDLAPDLLFLTGDFIELHYRTPEFAVPLLQEIRADRGGKWAVLGNHDFFPKDKVVGALQDAEFTVLENSRGHIEVEQQRLYIAGLEDALNAKPDIEQTLVGLSEEDCVLLLAHEPDTADVNCEYPIGAQFSGHSHGGQVRIPFYGPIFPQKYAEKYVQGLYQVGPRKVPLYVSRGIGTTQLPIRFCCRPEITLFTLN